MIKIHQIGAYGLNQLSHLGQAGLLLLQILQGILRPSRHFALVKQLYFIGVQTWLIIAVSGLFVGMVLSLQGYYILSQFGAEATLGVMVAVSLFRELGPVVAALLFAGRAGSALTAEIGLMKTTEQLVALEMMAVNPVAYVLAPRFLAGLLALPLLTLWFNTLGILGGWFVATGLLGVDDGIWWSQMQAKIDGYDDIANGMIKSLVFAFTSVWIALYQGYAAYPSASGVSQATTRTVVHASLAILGLDFILTALMFHQ